MARLFIGIVVGCGIAACVPPAAEPSDAGAPRPDAGDSDGGDAGEGEGEGEGDPDPCPADDGFEPNDDPAGATVIELGETDAAICGETEDWFFLPVRVGCSAQISLHGDVVDVLAADLDLYVTDQAGNEIESSTDFGSDEEITIGVTEENWRIVVAGAGFTGYALFVRQQCLEDIDCTNDPYQPDGSPYNPYVALGDGDVFASAICGQPDYFLISTTPGCTLHVTESGAQNVFLAVVEARSGGLPGTAALATSTRDGDLAVLDFLETQSGHPRYLRVSASGGFSAGYQVEVESTCGEGEGE